MGSQASLGTTTDLPVASWFVEIVVKVHFRQGSMDFRKDRLLFWENYLHTVYEDLIFNEFFCGLTCIKAYYNKKIKSCATTCFLV